MVKFFLYLLNQILTVVVALLTGKIVLMLYTPFENVCGFASKEISYQRRGKRKKN